MNPKPPHFGQHWRFGFWMYPRLLQHGHTTIPYFSGSKFLFLVNLSLVFLELPFPISFFPPDSSPWNHHWSSKIVPVLQNHPINNFAAGNAPPAEKMFACPVKLLIHHDPLTSMTCHMKAQMNLTQTYPFARKILIRWSLYFMEKKTVFWSYLMTEVIASNKAYWI